MKQIFYFALLLNCFFGYTQCKTELIATILDEHIERELPRLNLSKDDIIIIVGISYIEKDDIAISIDAFPSETYPNVADVKKINGVRVKFYFNGVSNKLIRKINKHFKTIDEIREVHVPELVSLTHYRGVSSFQVNNKNEFYIISTPDDDYYYNRFKVRKLKFSRDLKFSKDF